METRIALMEGLADVMEFADMELQSSGISTLFLCKNMFSCKNVCTNITVNYTLVYPCRVFLVLLERT